MPIGLLNQEIDFPLDRTFYDFTYDGENGEASLSKVSQVKSFKRLVSDTPDMQNVIIFTSRHDYRKVRLLALLAFVAYFENNKNPIWYQAHGALDRVEKSFNENGLLLIDSVTDNMAQYKTDKVHDFCQKYCHKPIFICHHGLNPYEFCIDKLGVKPVMVFNLDKSMEKKVRRL